MKKTVPFLMLSVFLMACMMIPLNESDGATGFTVRDGTGTEFHYDEPAERVVVQGSGAALTIADAGAMGKIVAVDRYSTYEYTGFEKLRGMDDVTVLDSFYGENNHESIITELVNMVENGELSKDDTIILTSYPSNETLRGKLTSDRYGFTKVLLWMSKDITEYGQVQDFVETVSKVVTGTVPDSVNDMESKVSDVESVVDSNRSSPKALYAWYYGNELQVGNNGIMTSMLELCGADDIGHDPGNDAERYGDIQTIIDLVGANRDAVVFVSDGYFKTGKTVEDFRSEVFNGDGSVKIVQAGLNWNNWCPESADGLTEMASALYDPDYWNVAESVETTDNTLVIALIVLVSIACIGGIVIMTRRNGRDSLPAMAVIMTCAALLVVFLLLDLSWAGTRTLSISEVWNALTGNGTWGTDIIVNHQNLPRVLFGIFVGAGLAVTGAVMQALFRNPLATPYILGLSSGASLGAALAILFSIPFIPLAVAQPVLAFVLCFATTILVYMISRSGGSVIRTETLVLAGVAVSSLISAIVSFLTYIAPSEEMGSIVFWSMGSLGTVTWEEMAIGIPIILIGILIMLTESRNLNAMMLGDAHAMDLGVDVRRTRLLILMVSSVVVAACVCFVGTIGFVGLVIPHIVRLILGPDNRLIIPISAIGGGAFLIMCDYIAHLVAPYYGVLPIGVVTSLIGAPFFIYLLCRRKKEVGW